MSLVVKGQRLRRLEKLPSLAHHFYDRHSGQAAWCIRWQTSNNTNDQGGR